MFGTSGIRGIYGKEVDEELARRIANIFAEDVLVIGRDIRKSGVPLAEAVTEGALAAGSDVLDAGIVPTPTLALAAKNCRGIMITASHNPPEYNGLKLIENGKEISKELEKEITEKYKANKQQEKEKGTVSRKNIIDKHKKLISSLVEVRKKPRIIVDCNGAASVITPYVLSDLGCEVISINASTECFNRQSEPCEKNLSYLPGLIRESRADFAIAHDGDGDRCVVFDDKGSMLPLDVQLAIMIEHEMENSSNKKIVSTVEASLAIRDVVEDAGGTIEIAPVGSTYVGDILEKNGALFGGEPCGEYIYQESVHVPDAILAAAKFAEIFCKEGKFSEIRKKYKENFMHREKFPAKDKRGSVEKIRKQIKIDGKIRDDDGIRIDEEDGWFLIRASGTEPIVRLTMEYKSKERLEERKKELRELIRGNL